MLRVTNDGGEFEIEVLLLSDVRGPASIAQTLYRETESSKELRLTNAGLERLRAGFQGWKDAQREFATAFGDQRTVGLRALLHAVAATDLPTEAAVAG